MHCVLDGDKFYETKYGREEKKGKWTEEKQL